MLNIVVKKPKTRHNKPIMVDNVRYPDAETVVKAGKAKNVVQVYKRISRKSFSTWFYAN